MKRIHVVGGVLAAAALAGGGAAVGTALTGPAVPVAMAATAPGSTAPGATAPGATAPGLVAAPAGIGTAALAPGTALVDGTGRTLYLFEADTGTTSTCTGACAQVWPPVLASGPTGAGGAARAALVSSAARPDGTLQVTYNGHPLYYFAGDKAPGEAKGQGIHNFGGGWYVVTPAGDKIDTDDMPAAGPAPAPRPAPSASSGSGYGY
jgi:predicted lipoprotein with Yx(FWY)xxD motif